MVGNTVDLLLKVYGNNDCKQWNQLTEHFSEAELGGLVGAGWLKETDDWRIKYRYLGNAGDRYLGNAGDLNLTLKFPLTLRYTT